MSRLRRASGFTLLEVMLVITIVGVLATLAVPAYRDYIERARSADILLKYDAIRGGIAADVASVGSGNCADLSAGVAAANLKDDYARLSIGYETITATPTDGYRPVLVICAKTDRHGAQGVGVAHAAHHEFSLTNHVEAGAVVTDSVVSFAVPLTQGNKASCLVPTGAKLTACGDPVAVPTATAMAVPNVAPVVAPTKQQVLAPQCRPPQHQMVDRAVMTFGSNLDSYVMNQGNLDTGGDMTEFSAEVAVVGGQQVATSGQHGATMLSYATPSSTNEFLLWNPTSVKIEWKGSDIDTGVNVNDGQNHRISFTWESASGLMILYDNGVEAWRGNHHQGEVLRGNGKLVLGQDQDTYGGGFHHNDAFQGQIVTASLANRVAPPD